MNRRSKLTTSFLVLILCLALGFGSVASAQVKTITMYHAFTSNTLMALRNLIADFQKEHPDIRVRAEYVGDALSQKLQASIAAGNPPDLSWLESGMHADLAKVGAIYNLEQEFI